MSYPTRSISDRLQMYSTRAPSGCQEWNRALDKDGYGRLLVIQGGRKQTKKAHRLAYELHIGPIPNGMFVCHKCDNPSCIEPLHLFLGTAADNNADKMAKGRYKPGGKPHPGSKNGRAKLDEQQVVSIRHLVQAYGIPAALIASSLDLSASAIQSAVRGSSWRTVSF